jgi:hypothetical protein
MTRAFGDFSREWRELNGLPEPAKRPDIEPFVPERIPIAPGQRPLRIGERVTCDRPAGVFQPCRCGSTSFTVREGKGPHAGQLVCNACHRRGRWLSRAHLEAV